MNRFTRARLETVTKNGGTYTLDYIVPNNKDLDIVELLASSNTDAIQIDLLYSDDNKSTWTNPWDSGSDRLLTVFVAAYIPVSGKPRGTWFEGDGTNVVFRLKITNHHPTNDANVFFLVKGWEKDRD